MLREILINSIFVLLLLNVMLLLVSQIINIIENKIWSKQLENEFKNIIENNKITKKD
jgi:hypothetical protein